MTSGVYGVYDRLKGYQVIFIEDNDTTAQRYFASAYDSAPERFKRDVELWHIGLMDTKTGELEVDDKYFLMNFGEEK